jgi:hypothetical protein
LRARRRKDKVALAPRRGRRRRASGRAARRRVRVRVGHGRGGRRGCWTRDRVCGVDQSTSSPLCRARMINLWLHIRQPGCRHICSYDESLNAIQRRGPECSECKARRNIVMEPSRLVHSHSIHPRPFRQTRARSPKGLLVMSFHYLRCNRVSSAV